MCSQSTHTCIFDVQRLFW